MRLFFLFWLVVEWDDWWKLKLKRKKRSMRSYLVYLDAEVSSLRLKAINYTQKKKETVALNWRIAKSGPTRSWSAWRWRRKRGQKEDLINWKGAVSLSKLSTCLLSVYSGISIRYNLAEPSGRKSRWEIKPLKGNFSYYMAWCLYRPIWLKRTHISSRFFFTIHVQI